MNKLPLVILIFFYSLVAAAQKATSSAISSASSSVAPSKTLEVYEVVIYPNNKIYTPELAAQGVQGTALLALNLDENFSIVSSEISEKSRDELVDSMALSLLKPKVKVGFKVGDKYRHDLIKVKFTKDELLSLRNKTCGDVIVDGQYFKKIYPEKDESDLEFWAVTGGLMYINYLDKSKKPLNTEKTRELVMEECRLRPEKNVFQTYQHLAQFN